MSIYRINKKTTFKTINNVNNGFDSYLERLMKLIPSEVVGLYLIGYGFIKDLEKHIDAVNIIWLIFCAVALIIVRAKNTMANNQVQWPAVFISLISYFIWVISLGGVVAEYLGTSFKPEYASLLILGWTFIVPYLYHGN